MDIYRASPVEIRLRVRRIVGGIRALTSSFQLANILDPPDVYHGGISAVETLRIQNGGSVIDSREPEDVVLALTASRPRSTKNHSSNACQP